MFIQHLMEDESWFESPDWYPNTPLMVDKLWANYSWI